MTGPEHRKPADKSHEMDMEQEFYHVCSEGMEKNIIFRNRDEFIMGMNYVAVCLQKFDVTILCFCLMANHFHFILMGSFRQCMMFGNEYKRMCAMMMRRCRNQYKAMRLIEMQIKKIDSRSYLENAIVYVLRNPMVAGYRLLPQQYPWSSGDCYFRTVYSPKGISADSVSGRTLAKILKSKTTIPGKYIINDEGMISPLNYIDHGTVEQLFGHPSRFLGSLSAKKETEFEIFLGIADSYNPDMQELRESVKELLKVEFGVKAVSQLSMEERMRLCGLMRRNFRASRKQIAMITRLDLETINKII